MPYDEFGNYIPGNEPDLDQMRYELSLADTVKQMINSPANKAPTLEDVKNIGKGFASAGESLVRGAAAAPFGMMGDVIKHFQETPIIPGVTDKLSINDVFPGYGTIQEAVAPTPVALPRRQVPNMSVAPEQPKQELFGLPYATTGDILAAAEKRYTAPFGDKEANDFMESLGMFMSPQMAAGARKGIINMVETTGRMPSLTADTAQAFARDYANAMNGVYPETPTAGSMAADFARQGKKAASAIEDVTYGNYQRSQVRRAAQGVPEDYAYDPLRARREAQAEEAYTAPEGAVPMYAVKEKGGNWLSQGLDTLHYLKKPIESVGASRFDTAWDNANPQKIANHIAEMEKIGYAPEQIQKFENDIAVNRWIDKKLGSYVRNEMGTPSDPVRKLADEEILHMPLEEIPTRRSIVEQYRKEAGYPEEGLAQTPLGKQWERATDYAISTRPAAAYQEYGKLESRAEKDPWVKKLERGAPVHTATLVNTELGFEHLVDELSNAISPNSDIPQHLKLQRKDLEKMAVPDAIRHVSKINDWRTAQMEKATVEDLKDFPVAYDAGDGYKIYDLTTPKTVPSEYTIEPYTDETGKQWFRALDKYGKNYASATSMDKLTSMFTENQVKLDKALKNEGKQMGHCVGGYTEDVASGRSKIFTLRDPKGRAHVTIETSDQGKVPTEHLELGENLGQEEAEGDQLFRNLEAVLRERGFENAADIAETEAFGNPHENPEVRDAVNAAWPEAERRLEDLRQKLEKNQFNIEQIKGKSNAPVLEKYRSYIQNFLNENKDQIARANDLDNVGLIDTEKNAGWMVKFLRREYGEDGIDLFNAAVQNNPDMNKRFMTEQEIKNLIETRPEPQASVKAQGNLNFTPTLSADKLKGADIQPVGNFIQQIKNMKGITNEGLKLGLNRLESIDPSTKISKQEFIDKIEPSFYNKVDLKNAASENVHALELAEQQAHENYEPIFQDVADRLGLDEKYVDDLLDYHRGAALKDLSEEVQNALKRDNIDYSSFTDLVDESFNQVVNSNLEDMYEPSFEGYQYAGSQRLAGHNDEANLSGYFEFGVTHPEGPRSYKHYSNAPEGTIGHVRGTFLNDFVESYPGAEEEILDLPDPKLNSMLIEEIQSDANKVIGQTGPLHQIHGTLFKAAIQHALENGADTVYLPTAKTIAKAREEKVTRYAPIYDQQIIKEGLNPLKSIKGVSINKIGDAYYEINFTPEAKKRILEGIGQSVPGYKKGGIIRKETGGRVEPTAPSPNVNDQSKPVTPPKPIINPDAPEFKDLFNRERAIRSGGGAPKSGGPSADIKQIMNPRNINYNAGGKISVDQMRYELLRKQ